MSEKTMELSDFLKGLQQISSPEGISMLCTTSSGEVMKTKSADTMIMSRSLGVADIDQIKEPGFYHPTADAINYPPLLSTANSSDQIIFLGRASYGILIYISLTGKYIFKRSIIDSVWRGWSFVTFETVP